MLEEIGDVLIIDGLDEISLSSRHEIYKELQSIFYDFNIKTIASCRSGDFNRSIQGYSTVEIETLTEQQIIDIADLWISEPRSFLKSLSESPYADVSNRPLMLCTLIYIYQNSGSLPDQPSSVYRILVRLLLTEWSEQRGIVRESQYAGFDNDRKMDFLSHLAHWLTVQFKSKKFTTEALELAYAHLAPRFKLPIGESHKVAREIESHSGIVVKVSDHYEFSHLYLQEYLAANYIVRKPLTRSFYNYIDNYPHPAAIAVTISSDPTLWLAVVLSDEDVLRLFNRDNFAAFVSRLTIERPNMIPSYDLGFAVAKLIGYMSIKYSKPRSPIDGMSTKTIDALVAIDGVYESIEIFSRNSVF